MWIPVSLGVRVTHRPGGKLISVGSVGIPGRFGSEGSVITDGSCGIGNSPGGGVVVLVDALGYVLDGAGFSVMIVGVVCSGVRTVVDGTTGGALDGGNVVVVVVLGVMVVAGSCGGAPCASWMMPQMISAIRTTISTPHPAIAIGLRQPGIGSCGSGCSPAYAVGSLTP